MESKLLLELNLDYHTLGFSKKSLVPHWVHLEAKSNLKVFLLLFSRAHGQMHVQLS